MKRVWFAIIFIGICISACVAEQVMIKNVHHNLNKIIMTAEADPTEKNIKEVQKYYKKSSRLLTAICDTQRLDELNQAIKYLDDKDKNIGAALATARTTNDSIYEAQLISASNVF